MNYILYDGSVRTALLPFTFTRPVADIRVGILTIREKWEKFLGTTTTTVTEEYLSEKFPMVELDENIMINASYCPNEVLVEMLSFLKPFQAIVKDEEVIAFYTTSDQEEVYFEDYEWIELEEGELRIEKSWDSFQKNDQRIREEFLLLTEDRVSERIPSTVQVLGRGNILVEEGAVLIVCTLNATTGPIDNRKDAANME